MIRELRFSGASWDFLLDHLLNRQRQERDEQLAFMLAGRSTSREDVSLIIREVLPAGPADFDAQDSVGLRPNAEFVARALSRCRSEGWSLVEAHSHPFDNSGQTSFSGTDLDNDRRKMPAVARILAQEARHATMVVSPQSFDVHAYDVDGGTIEPVPRVVVLGHPAGDVKVRRFPSSAIRDSGAEPVILSVGERWSRQEALLGVAGQETLHRTCIAIVGLGGLGSFTAVELAHAGVGRVVLIDPDLVDGTNLSRLLSAGIADVGRPKVEVVADALRRIDPELQVSAVQDSILAQAALSEALAADVILGCVDNHGARLVLNKLAVQHALPYIDAGTGARPSGELGGQVQVVLPGLGCLECRGFIDPLRATLDLASPGEMAVNLAHGYGTGTPAPSIIWLNGVVASALVGVLLQLLIDGAEAPPGLLLYDARAHRMTPVSIGGSEDCVTCGPDGIFGFGDALPLYRGEDFAGTLPLMRL